jgi:septum formation protein
MRALTHQVTQPHPSLKVILASASPRRRELLSRLIPDFEIDVPDLDEEALAVADPKETAERLALAKALVVAARRPQALVIGGDTVVALGGRQFGKPSSHAEAAGMLSALSSRQHLVISGVALIWPAGQFVFSDVARVSFRALTQYEIEEYVATGEPMDKAGAYAIQGGAAGFVAGLEGDIETVIGLPLSKLAELLSIVLI